MKHARYFWSALFWTSLPFSALIHAQYPWSNVLSTSRAINWGNAGLPATLPDGETTPNPWTPPTRTIQYGSTITPSGVAATDLSNINTALSNCPNGDYVLLGPGKFLIQGVVNAYLHSCTLRGSGPQSTTLDISGSGVIYMGFSYAAAACALTSGSNFAAGSTAITCSNLSGTAPAVGELANLNQCDTGYTGTLSGTSLTCSGSSADNGGLFVCGYNTTCMSEPSGSASNASQFQDFIITSVSNNGGNYTIGLNHDLYMPNWSHSQTPVLSLDVQSYVGVGVGLEDMTVYTESNDTQTFTVQMNTTYASWMKGLRFVGYSGSYGDPVAISGSENSLLSNNYFATDPAFDGNYPGSLRTDKNSDILILNNVFSYGNYEGNGGDIDIVFAYNWMFDYFTAYPLDTVYDHQAYNSFSLYEGNMMGVDYNDDTWGTHDLYTTFRNYLPCYDAPYTTYSDQSLTSFSIGAYQRFDNKIGNALGSGECTSYQGTGVGVIYRIAGGDSLNASTLMRWGNVSTVTQSSDTPANSGVRFLSSEVPAVLTSPVATLENLIPSNNNLPCSFFLAGYTSTTCTPHSSGGTGLSWWKVCTSWTSFPTSCAATALQPFPFAGPDVSGGVYVNGYAYDNPASTAWKSLPIDTAYQKSYLISSSSWAAGIETLTFAGGTLPNLEHLMGPFQTSAMNSACTSGARFNTNNEILMVGSSSTTVQYALASNPGVSCTGTMLFPDVRQFDERVYQADSGSGTSSTQPGNPSGLTANFVATP